MHHGGKIAKRVTRLSIAQQDTDKQRPEELRTGLQVLVTKYRTKQRGRRSSRRRKFIIISDNCLASVFPLSCEGCPQNAERNRERKKERGVNYWLVERKKEIIYKQCSTVNALGTSDPWSRHSSSFARPNRCCGNNVRIRRSSGADWPTVQVPRYKTGQNIKQRERRSSRRRKIIHN